ncbi:organic cation transporter protein-like [Pollicipes pollicipes]|uniref:organic cation transporter protein-like n=1 Tax=Pollicipes pollicipes TaxID=41117 RepID=UPI0018851834|nr:organic cation transporter protein-like [Pollicipes pollicipes]
MELTSIEARAFCGIFINAFFAVGEALTGVFPIFVKDWKSLQLIYSAPIVLFCPYWFFLPESPRWLMAVGRKDKAEEVLRNVAKWNGKPFPEELITKERSSESLQEAQAINESFISVIKSPVLLKRAFILAFQWLVVAMVYYGISMVSTDLGGDVYTNFILTMLIEIPSYVFCALTLNPLGRKLVIGGAFLLSGLGAICAGLVPANELEWLTTTLALLGKFGAASAFSLLFLYTAELCPSGMRVMGVGMASACSRIGSVLAPVIADLGDDTATLPLCIFGVCGLLAGGMTAFLPETSGRDLPTTVAEAADFGRRLGLRFLKWPAPAGGLPAPNSVERTFQKPSAEGSSEARSGLAKPGTGDETVDDDVIFLPQPVRRCRTNDEEVVIVSPTEYRVPNEELGNALTAEAAIGKEGVCYAQRPPTGTCDGEGVIISPTEYRVPNEKLGAARAAEAAIGEEDVSYVQQPLPGKWSCASLKTPKHPRTAWRMKRASRRLAPVFHAVAAFEAVAVQPVVVETDGPTVRQRLEETVNRHQLVRSRSRSYEVADSDESSSLERGLPGLFRPLCDACTAVQVGERWTKLEPLLRAHDNRDGWRQVRTPSDRTALYLLS